MERYNLVVVGAGSGGLVVAAGGAGLGARVALVEKHPETYRHDGRDVVAMGGDCLQFGCVPSKALLRAAKAAHAPSEAGRFGVTDGGDPGPHDLAAVMDFVRRAQGEIAPVDSVGRFQELGVDVLLGAGRLRDPHVVEVDGKAVWGRHVVLATGSRALVPEVPGLAEAGYLTNETVFSLTKLPARLLVMGGGPIGTELGQALARLGSKVTIVSSTPHVCPKEDADAATLLAARLRAEGVTVLDNARATRVAAAAGGAKVVSVKSGSSSSEIEVDDVLVATGRRPNVEGLNLEGAGVARDDKGFVKTDAACRTSARSVWAIGDVAGRFLFTHWAGYQAGVVLRNTLSPFAFAVCDYESTPWVTYTEPEIARVGLNERDAKERGIPHRVFRADFSHNDRAVCDGTAEGFSKILVDGKGRILGATIVHAHAGDLIGEVVLAKKKGLGLSALGSVIRPYPTLSEIHGAVAREALKTALTPGRKRFLGKLAAWMRR